MAWFREDPWKDGVRTTATIERVVVTDYSRDLSGGGKEPEVHLTFRFTDGQGAAVVHEHRLAVEKVPAPGSIVDIAYMPNKLDTIDYDRQTVRPPDPDVPRGWSAGIYEVEDLGTHRSGSLEERREIDAQRELFRTGRRARAEVVGMHDGDWRVGRRNESEMVFTLRIDGTTSKRGPACPTTPSRATSSRSRSATTRRASPSIPTSATAAGRGRDSCSPDRPRTPAVDSGPPGGRVWIKIHSV